MDYSRTMPHTQSPYLDREPSASGPVVYAGIDEAGYGPLFGPLVVGRSVLVVPAEVAQQEGTTMRSRATMDRPDVWRILRQGVCRKISDRKKRIAVNDSKKLHSQTVGVRHLETGALAFAALGKCRPAHVGDWIERLRWPAVEPGDLPTWYRPDADAPWDKLPVAVTEGELGVAGGMLSRVAAKAQVQLADFGAAVVLEDRFNQMVAATRSKASVAFTFVSSHLRTIWDQFGQHGPTVVVDRQSGRTHYRELLALTFPDEELRIVEETPACSVYHLCAGPGASARRMTVRFEVDADEAHFPTALASMICKYTRELMMRRFNAWFARHAPQVKPTAGYGKDGKRFWNEIQPTLERLGIAADLIKRMC